MEIIFTLFSILIIFAIIFILVLFVTTLSVYNEIRPKKVEAYNAFFKELSNILRNNTELSAYKCSRIYKEFVEIVPNNINYHECLKLLIFEKNNEYQPSHNNEKLIKKLIDYYNNLQAYTLVEFFESLLVNNIVNSKDEITKMLTAVA